MKTLFRTLPILALTGCASVFNGTHQDMTIGETLPGASYQVTNQYGRVVASGKTPANIELERGDGYFKTQSYKVRFAKPGFKPKVVDVAPSLNPLYFGNIALGGIIGMLIVDPITGAMYDLSPRHVETTLEPDASVPTNAQTSAGSPPIQTISDLRPKPGAAPKAMSRHDYELREQAKRDNCRQDGPLSFENVEGSTDRFTLICPDGRSAAYLCQSGRGCSPI